MNQLRVYVNAMRLTSQQRHRQNNLGTMSPLVLLVRIALSELGTAE
jgi:hypothetical protein